MEDQTAQANIPQESISKHSRFVLLALTLDLVAAGIFVVYDPALVGTTTPIRVPSAGAFLFMIPSTMIAVLGLFMDRQKVLSSIGLILSLLPGCILGGLIMFVIDEFTHQFQ